MYVCTYNHMYKIVHVPTKEFTSQWSCKVLGYVVILESSSNKNEMEKKFQRILVTLAVGSYSKFESYFLAIHIA